MGFGAAPDCSETSTLAEDLKAFCWEKETISLSMRLAPGQVVDEHQGRWMVHTDGLLVRLNSLGAERRVPQSEAVCAAF